MIKRLISLVLAVLTVFALAACGSAGGTTDGGDGKQDGKNDKNNKNAVVISDPIKAAMEARGARDLTEGLGGTFHDFGRKPLEKYSKIDYIFAQGNCTDCYIIPDNRDGQGLYYSDHFAIMAEIEI